MARAGSSTFAYDAENRLVSASGAVSGSLTYDGLGRLLATSGGGETATTYLYDGEELVAEYATSGGALLNRYVHGAGIDDPMVWYEGSGTTSPRFLHADERGSIVAVSSSTGTVTDINTYDTWGVPAPGNAGRFQYTGQIWLPQLSLYQYKARMYGPRIGRFMQTDPIGYEDGMNLYTYVGNDPVNGIDPDGSRVVWLPPDNPIQRSGDQAAILGYLSKSETFNSQYQTLTSSENTYYIAETTQDVHQYSPETRTITINPTEGLL